MRCWIIFPGLLDSSLLDYFPIGCSIQCPFYDKHGQDDQTKRFIIFVWTILDNGGLSQHWLTGCDGTWKKVGAGGEVVGVLHSIYTGVDTVC